MNTQTPSFESVALRVDGAIAHLRFNRPEQANAFNHAMWEDLPRALEWIGTQRAVRAVVLSGEGKHFTGGIDLSVVAWLRGLTADPQRATRGREDVLAFIEMAQHAFNALERCPVPVIAAVHGAVAGAGLSLMCDCDLVVAAQGTRFLTAYDRVGAAPDFGGTYFLPRVLGMRRAAQFLFLGETLDADAALAAGLVNQVVAADQLAATAEALARRIASGPTRAYGQYKRLVDRAFERELPAQLEAERAAFKAATKTADFR